MVSLTNKGTISAGNSTTKTTTAVAVRADNILNLQNNGIITTGTSGANIAVQAGAAANIVNESKIIALGANSHGVFSGGDVSLTNSGAISAAGAGATGIRAGGSSKINNSGTVVSDDIAIYTAYLSQVTNTNKITAGRVGVGSDNDVDITNRGSILAPTGVIANGTAIVRNSGTIGSGGKNSTGVVGGNAVKVENSGTITGEIGVAVSRGGESSTVTNSGSIIGTGGTAIRLTKAADTLTLKETSRIQGIIATGGGGDTINVEVGKGSGSQVIVFDSLQGANVNVTGSRPAKIIGNAIVTVDPTNFIVSDASLMEVTGAASNLAQRRMGNATAGQPADTTRGYWVQALGGGRQQQATTGLNGWRHAFGGMMGGFETAPFADYRIGAFAGGAFGTSRVSNSNDSVASTYVFGGVYGRFQPGAAFVDFNVVGGYVNNSTKRAVNSNVAAGGIETASSSSTGYYVSPQVGVGYRVQYDQSGTVTPAVKVRYLMAQQGASAETGTVAPVAVAARASHNIETRAEVEFSRSRRSANGGGFRMYETIGVVVQNRLSGSAMNGTIIGTQISLTSPVSNSSVSAFFGAGVEWASARGATLFANFETEVRLDKSIGGNARAGAIWAF